MVYVIIFIKINFPSSSRHRLRHVSDAGDRSPKRKEKKIDSGDTSRLFIHTFFIQLVYPGAKEKEKVERLGATTRNHGSVYVGADYG